MARNLVAELCRPFIAGLRGNLVETEFPELRPRQFGLPKTPEPVSLALRLDRRIALKVPFEEVHRLSEYRRREMAAGFLMVFQEIGQPQLGCCPNVGFETFANDLADDFNSAIVIAVADVLQQVRHLWKRAPLAIFGQVLFSFLERFALRVQCLIRARILRDTKTGYK